MASIKPLSKRISIFLTVDSTSTAGYFNPHDPAPIYSRQLSQEFEVYITNAVLLAKRHSTVRYKVTCSAKEKRNAELLMQAIRKHFTIKKTLKEGEFAKFKKKAYSLLALSFIVVMICQGLLPFIFGQDHRIHTTFSNALDVFSWVILWKPIERLIFYWNPFLKDISILEKLINAEVIIIQKSKLNGHHTTTPVIADTLHQ